MGTTVFLLQPKGEFAFGETLQTYRKEVNECMRSFISYLIPSPFLFLFFFLRLFFYFAFLLF